MPPHRARPRHRRLSVAALATLGVAACATYWPTVSATSATSPDETYACARTTARELGFKPSTWNDRSRVLDARRTNDSASVDLPGTEKHIDILAVRVRTGGGGRAASTLDVRAETVIQHYTRRGLDEDGTPASPAAQQAARALVARCGG